VLVHHRWSVPIIAEIHCSSGAKFVTLVKRLGVSRDSLCHTLKALIHEGWVMKNPGYGHPMRPEYLLTPSGKKLAPWCRRLMSVLAALGVEETASRKWSMPVALALLSGQSRFSELQASLPGLTARGLALALKNLQLAGLVERWVSEDYPPSTHYRLTRRGHRLAVVLETL
jgi:DNA-binding HxlR family transcriptional regulator